MQERKVAIVGFGYVGLTLGAFLAGRGLRVHGIDANADLVRKVAAGECPIYEPGLEELFAKAHAEGRLTAGTDAKAVADCRVVLVTVGTPLGADHKPSMTAIRAVARDLAPAIAPGTLVVLKSTVTPGVTREAFAAEIERVAGKRPGRDYLLCFCPERLAEGTALADLARIPVVVGAWDDASAAAASGFFEGLGLATIRVASPEEAEFTKLACNLWIDLNIALANELALLAEKLGVNVFRAIQAANTLPKGAGHVNILAPGAGVGGSCLVKDPWFVHELAREKGLDLLTPSSSRRANDRMPGHMLDLMRAYHPDIRGRTFAVLGLAFKEATDDLRSTPALPLIQALKDGGATVRVHDAVARPERVRQELAIELAPGLAEAVTGCDGAFIVTAHKPYREADWTALARLAAPGFAVVDGRNSLPAQVLRAAGVRCSQVGVGGAA